MISKIFSLSFLALISLSLQCSLHASKNEEEEKRLFNTSGRAASQPKVRNFLSPCFTMERKSPTKLQSSPQEAIELLGKLATQFVTEVSSKLSKKDGLKEILWSSYNGFKKLTLDTSDTAAIFFHIDRFEIDKSLIVSVENALTQRVQTTAQGDLPAGHTSDKSRYNLTHTRNAFATIKQRTCLALLSSLKELGEDVDSEANLHKTLVLDQDQSYEDADSDEEENLEETLYSLMQKIEEQNNIYQNNKIKYLELITEQRKAQALERAVPQKKHLISLILSFLSIDESDHEAAQRYLTVDQKASSDLSTSSSILDLEYDVENLDDESASAFLNRLQDFAKANPLIEDLESSGETQTMTEPLELFESLLPPPFETSEVEKKIKKAERQVGANRKKLTAIEQSVGCLRSDLSKTIDYLFELNEPLDTFLGNFHAYLGGTQFKTFLTVFAFNPALPYCEKLSPRLKTFPKTNKEMLTGLWKFIYGLEQGS